MYRKSINQQKKKNLHEVQSLCFQLFAHKDFDIYLMAACLL